MKAAIVVGLRRLGERQCAPRGTGLHWSCPPPDSLQAAPMEPEPLELLGWAPPPVVGAAQAGPLGQPPVPLPAPALGGGHAAWALPDIAWDPHLVVRHLLVPRRTHGVGPGASVCWAPSLGGGEEAPHARRTSPARPPVRPAAGGYHQPGGGPGGAAAAGACARRPGAGLAGPGPAAANARPVCQRAQLAGRPGQRPAPRSPCASRPGDGAHVQGARLPGGAHGPRPRCPRPGRRQRRPGHLPLQLAPPSVSRPPPRVPGAVAGPGAQALVPGAVATLTCSSHSGPVSHPPPDAPTPVSLSAHQKCARFEPVTAFKVRAQPPPGEVRERGVALSSWV